MAGCLGPTYQNLFTNTFRVLSLAQSVKQSLWHKVYTRFMKGIAAGDAGKTHRYAFKYSIFYNGDLCILGTGRIVDTSWLGFTKNARQKASIGG
jgi:hypothetical protein